MANHCVDVICLDCGATWCARGCGDRTGPNPDYLALWWKQRQEWSDKYEDGRKHQPVMAGDDLQCRCGSRKVAME